MSNVTLAPSSFFRFFFFLFQTVGRLSNDAAYSSGRNNGGTLFRCRDGRCSTHPWKKGYKQRDVNASLLFPLLPHVEPITASPHERDMNRSSVAARMERCVTCVDTNTLKRAADLAIYVRCIWTGTEKSSRNFWNMLYNFANTIVYSKITFPTNIGERYFA